MPRGRSWTEIEVNRLIALRDDEGLIWSAVARKLGRRSGADGGIGQCCAAYNYHKAKRARDAAAMIAAGITPPSPPPSPRAPCDNSSIAPAEVALLVAPVKRARYFSGDGDLMTRIVAQGLTAGYFGDPPPGRSALDQRQGGK